MVFVVIQFVWMMLDQYIPACYRNEVEDVGNEDIKDDNFSKVTYAYKEWYDDYDSAIEVLKTEDVKVGKEKDVIRNEDYKMEPEDNDPEVLAMAWEHE
ncbi:hypothetical protein HanHA300_Chr09g0305091 [Helianthus annuus]|nr:hypothetical protein HanHA300_Chr09g0305091 [Helianthus annuus]